MILKSKILIITTTIIIVAAIMMVYYFYNPAECGWMPKCPLKFITGIDCPGCGSQRALHAILHGEIGEAWHLNPFIFIGIPFLAISVAGCYAWCPGHKISSRIIRTPWFAPIYIAIFFAWWVIRNL